MDKTSWLSILPAIITIAIAIWSKRILPSLLIGLLVGSYLLNTSLIGGPSSGKTTTVNLLKERGYITTFEHARHYLDTQRLKGRTIENVRK